MGLLTVGEGQVIGVFDLDSFIQFSLEVYTATNRRGEYPGMFPARGTNRREGNLRGESPAFQAPFISETVRDWLLVAMER